MNLNKKSESTGMMICEHEKNIERLNNNLVVISEETLKNILRSLS